LLVGERMLDFARNNLIFVCAACALSVGFANGAELVTEEEATASRESVLMSTWRWDRQI